MTNKRTFEHPLYGTLDLETRDIRHEEIRIAQEIMRAKDLHDLGLEAKTADSLPDALATLLKTVNFWK